MKGSSKTFQAALSFLNFLPLWVVVLFIDVRSIMKGGCVITEYLSVGAIILGVVLSGIVMICVLSRKQDSETDEYLLVRYDECRTIAVEILLTYVLPLAVFKFTLWFEVLEFLVFFGVVFLLSCRHRAAFAGVFLELIGYRCYCCKLKLWKHGKPVIGSLVQRYVLIKQPLNGAKCTVIRQVNTLNNEVMICMPV